MFLIDHRLTRSKISLVMLCGSPMLALIDDLAQPSAWRDSDLIVPLLIIVLGLGIIIALLCIGIFNRLPRPEQRMLPFAQRDSFNLFAHGRTSRPAIFELPSRWLAIKSSNLFSVQSALGLHNPTPCSWDERLARPRKLFISPPIAGWILVMGSGLPDPSDDVDKLYHFIRRLSRKLGEVQFFSVNRILNHHDWVKASEGKILRGYAWAGCTLWNQGNKTPAEMSLGLKCFDYTEPMERISFTLTDPASFNVEKVPLLAARWSLDLTTIDARMLKESRGVAGEIQQSRIH